VGRTGTIASCATTRIASASGFESARLASRLANRGLGSTSPGLLSPASLARRLRAAAGRRSRADRRADPNPRGTPAAPRRGWTLACGADSEGGGEGACPGPPSWPQLVRPGLACSRSPVQLEHPGLPVAHHAASRLPSESQGPEVTNRRRRRKPLRRPAAFQCHGITAGAPTEVGPGPSRCRLWVGTPDPQTKARPTRVEPGWRALICLFTGNGHLL
jgi:hypothetical protein